MIQPDMATMLALHRDRRADCRRRCWRRSAREVADVSFNCTTVDGDTSTNDSFVLAATGTRRDGADQSTRRSAPRALCARRSRRAPIELAQAIVRDGEGATKFITIRVEGGRDVDECRQVAFAIAHSPLVKTAFFASDPNLGRILCAIGNAAAPDTRSGAASRSGSTTCWWSTRAGARRAYREEDGQRVMKQERDHRARASSAAARPPPPCGPATSRTTT